jgi:TonB family protein
MFLVHAVVALAATVTAASAQADNPPKPVSVGAQAVAIVLKHYALNPSAHLPTTGLALPLDGAWSVSKTRPAACPQTDEKCVEVFYDVPADQVRCSWVVLLNADATDGQFLDENDNAATFLLRVLSKTEASPLALKRQKPVYPPIAIAVRQDYDAVIEVTVDKSGEVQNARVLSGGAMIQSASLDAARKWTFKPLTVGARPVSYQVKLAFKYRPNPVIATGDLAP